MFQQICVYSQRAYSHAWSINLIRYQCSTCWFGKTNCLVAWRDSRNWKTNWGWVVTHQTWVVTYWRVGKIFSSSSQVWWSSESNPSWGKHLKILIKLEFSLKPIQPNKIYCFWHWGKEKESECLASKKYWWEGYQKWRRK